MALISENGEYLKIDTIMFESTNMNSLHYSMYQSLEHRENGDNEFLHKRTGQVNSGALQLELKKLADPKKSIIDNLKTAGYNAIKADNFEFSEWENA